MKATSWLCLLALGSAACRRAAEEPLRVAVASDVEAPFAELGRRFTERTHRAVIFNVGSTGVLATQLTQGAPFDVFGAANRQAVDSVVKAGVCDATTVAPYARGELVVFSPHLPLTSLDELAEPRFTRFAIATPEQAPYGRAARESLERSGLWPRVQGRIVFGQNVGQTLQYVLTNNVDAAFVSHSQLAAIDGGSVLVVDPSLYAPLIQTIAVCTQGKHRDDGARFVDLVLSAEGQGVLAGFGFHAP